MTTRPWYRLAAATSHPVQYHAPLLQRLAAHPSVALTVFYGDDRSVAVEIDEGSHVTGQTGAALQEQDAGTTTL